MTLFLHEGHCGHKPPSSDPTHCRDGELGRYRYTIEATMGCRSFMKATLAKSFPLHTQPPSRRTIREITEVLQ